MVSEKLTPPPRARVIGASFAGFSDFVFLSCAGFISVLASFVGAGSRLGGAGAGSACRAGAVLRGPARAAFSVLSSGLAIFAPSRGFGAIK